MRVIISTWLFITQDPNKPSTRTFKFVTAAVATAVLGQSRLYNKLVHVCCKAILYYNSLNTIAIPLGTYKESYRVVKVGNNSSTKGTISSCSYKTCRMSSYSYIVIFELKTFEKSRLSEILKIAKQGL